MSLDLNELAEEVAKLEGGKVEVNIAQVKEVLHCLGQVLARYRWWAAVYLILKLRDRAIMSNKLRTRHSRPV
jgi:hypothetical protein